MATYITSTWSPSMMGTGGKATVEELDDTQEIREAAANSVVYSISHPEMAAMFSELLNTDVPAGKLNVRLQTGDTVYAIMPSFRITSNNKPRPKDLHSGYFRLFKIQIN